MTNRCGGWGETPWLADQCNCEERQSCGGTGTCAIGIADMGCSNCREILAAAAEHRKETG